MVAGFMAPYVFGKARESFVITTGIDTKLGSAPKSKVGETVAPVTGMCFFLKYARRIGRYFCVSLNQLLRKSRVSW